MITAGDILSRDSASKLGQNVKFGRIEKFLFLFIFYLVDGPYAQGKLLPSVYIPEVLKHREGTE